MKITAFDELYSRNLGTGAIYLGGSNGSNSGFAGGDVVGEPGNLSVVGLRQRVSLSSNMGDNTVGTVLTTIQSSPWLATFAVSSNSGVSFGSNSADVAGISAAGAAATASRSDHLHKGVRAITSSSSNTLQADTVNLRPGTNVAFGVTDTDGDGVFDTLTITASAPAAAGGGGGNVSTASAVTVDYGKVQLLTVRASANTEDDDFDVGSGSLAAKWLAYTGLDMTYSLSDLPGWLRATSLGAKLQAVPAGDWTIEAQVVTADIGPAGFVTTGLILTNGTTFSTATDARWYIGQNNALQSYRFVAEKFVSGTFSSTYSQWTSLQPGATVSYFLRINKSGTTYTLEYSPVGSLIGGTAGPWQRFFQIAALGFTPSHFGITSGSSGSLFNYFRRY